MNPVIKELLAQGRSQEADEMAIEEYRSISHATILSWLEESGLPVSGTLNTRLSRIAACFNPNKKDYFKHAEWRVIQKRSGNYTIAEIDNYHFGFSTPPELEGMKMQEVLKDRLKALEAEKLLTEAMLSGKAPATSMAMFRPKSKT